MVSRIPAAPLVASPTHPNSMSWSDDNLLAVASANIITILNPAHLFGPRGLVALPPNKPFPIGMVEREDMLNSSLLCTSLSRGTQPCARSMSWSPAGLAPNLGCLLSVCTTKGRVKVYCAPYPELRAEWVQFFDISDMLYDFLAATSFNQPSSISTGEAATIGDSIDGDHHKDNLDKRSSKRTKTEGVPELPVITAREYASRCALLSSLTCAWSPALNYFSGSSDPINCFHSKYAVLSVGGKSGHISFWKIHASDSCTNKHVKSSANVVLVGYLKAHNSWITTITWKMYFADSSESQLVLATGSSDGSVKMWLVNVEELARSSEINGACFSLLKEITPATSIPITSMSMATPVSVPAKLVLAIGKGSGSLEAWTCCISSRNFENAGVRDAHGQAVTGLEWTYDGVCLFSCSQDGSVCAWRLSGSSLHVLSFPLNSPFLEESKNALELSDPCFGLALSPGNLVLSLVHSLDSSLLNQMYQARIQKAVIEFLWVGDHVLEVSSRKKFDCGAYGLTEAEVIFWESSILYSINKYVDVDKELYLWDILAALVAIKQLSPKFAEYLVCRFFCSWFEDLPSDSPPESILLHIQSLLLDISTRKLHLFNIICRRLVLTETFPDEWKISQFRPKIANAHLATDVSFWNDLLARSEKELQERLVAFSFKVLLYVSSQLTVDQPFDSYWIPSGVAQMEQWVGKNQVSDQLKELVSKIRGLGARLSSGEYVMEESCSYCSASVPFGSPEVGFCSDIQRHKLQRCSVSMRLCNPSPLWSCMCCHRSAERFAPAMFFTLSKSSLEDISFRSFDLSVMKCSKPLCPFCGIMLTQSQPDFFLSASPV